MNIYYTNRTHQTHFIDSKELPSEEVKIIVKQKRKIMYVIEQEAIKKELERKEEMENGICPHCFCLRPKNKRCPNCD